MNYTQLTEEERYQIYGLLKAQHSQKEIAQIMNRSASTISREIKRNKGLKGYRPKQAHRLTEERRSQANKRIKITDEVKGWISRLLQNNLTPEQIAGRLDFEDKVTLHHESIYRYIYQDKANGGQLYTHLPRACKTYRKRYGSYDKRGQLVNRVSIDERPTVVDTKARMGDWEGDTVIGKGRQNALVTLVERKTLFTVVRRIKSKHADITADAIIASVKDLKDNVLTITFDNGKEFAQHERIGQQLMADIYFAHPYSSWERGANENTNGLLRRYFPKGTDFMALAESEIVDAVEQLNHRPRKTLGYKTPYELFTGQPEILVAA